MNKNLISLLILCFMLFLAAGSDESDNSVREVQYSSPSRDQALPEKNTEDDYETVLEKTRKDFSRELENSK